MKVLRIELTQSAAQYRRAETVSNKMTYPLPFPSTIIGALHHACGYKTYHPMDVSIQGEFLALQEEVYVDHCFLNSTMDDRGMLVKVPNGTLLSAQFEPVAKAKKSQGNSFKNGVTIDVLRPDLLAEYRQLLQKKEALDAYKKTTLASQIEPLKQQEKQWKDIAKKAEGAEKKQAKEKEKNIKAERKQYEDAFAKRMQEEYTLPMSRFKNLTTAPKRYEVLYDIKLIIHVRASEEILQDTMSSIDNLQSIGRSEDFVQVTACEWVDVTQDDTAMEDRVWAPYSMYIHKEDLIHEDEDENPLGYIAVNGKLGTMYYATKQYHIESGNGKRVFEKIPVLYASGAVLDMEELRPNNRVWIDTSRIDKPLIVDFL